MVTVETLYKNFGVLADAKDKAGEHESEYLSFIAAVKGGPGEKRLASQFITRFFKHFPGQALKAINALYDLCEDSDVNIRKQAIKDLSALCKVSPMHVPKITEALTQLFISDDPGELSSVQSSLFSLLNINPKGCLEGLFNQILAEGDEEGLVRERAMKFLETKLKTLPEDKLDKETEDFVVTCCKKVLEDVTKEEFMYIMDILRSLKVMSTVQGRLQLLDIITEQAELAQPLQVTDLDSVDRLMQCGKTAVPLFSKNVHSKNFVGYICDHVLPSLQELPSPGEGVNLQLEMLKLFAEISEHSGEIDKADERLEKVFNRLIEYMPLPPEGDEVLTEKEEPKLNFSYVECLMFAFHQLARRSPGFLASEASAERLKDFKLRLQYFARGVQIYIKQLRAALQGKTGDALKTEENRIKIVALKIVSNINNLIKDLFHNPPSYKATVTLSWKPVGQAKSNKAVPSETAAAGQKRITPITFDSDGAGGKKEAVNKSERPIYTPPGGKYSQKAGTFQPGQNRGGMRGRGRGGFRGRGFRGYRYQRY